MGAAGVAAPIAVVVILAGALAKFVAVNVNGPPNDAWVIFWSAKVVGLGLLVKVQVIWAAGKTFAAGMASNCPVRVPKLAGLPVTAAFASVQLAPLNVKELFALSEI